MCARHDRQSCFAANLYMSKCWLGAVSLMKCLVLPISYFSQTIRGRNQMSRFESFIVKGIGAKVFSMAQNRSQLTMCAEIHLFDIAKR
jgi:hypothetical protein